MIEIHHDAAREMAEEMLAGMPEPTGLTGGEEEGGDGRPTEEEVIEGITASPPDRDITGEIFNPDKHATGHDGKPAYTRTGRFRKRRKSRVGQPSPSQFSPTPQFSADPQPAPAAPPDNDAQYIGLAALTTQLSTQVCMGALSPAWKPTPEEIQSMTGAWAAYYKSLGMTDIPPGVALVLTITAYATPRIATDPTTQEKLGAAWNWISGGKEEEETEDEEQK